MELTPSSGTDRAGEDDNQGGNYQMTTDTDTTQSALSVDQQRIVRPLSPDGVADCPQCHSPQAVARHNADWTCHKCGYCETVDDDRELEREISEMLMACADWFGRNPHIKADPRAWQHLAVYWPNT